MRILKYLAVSLLSVVVLLLIVTNFSSVPTKIACTGEISTSNGAEPTRLYAVIEEYRWWVGLWGDSDGNLRIEIPNELVDYYSHVVKVGDQLQIYHTPGDLMGNFSKLSQALTLKLPFGFFEGDCKKIE